MTGELISILGGGESGVGAALLAKHKGFSVFVSDFGVIADKYKSQLVTNNISYEEGSHTLEVIQKSSLIVKSPGISSDAPIIKKISNINLPIISEIEFAYRHYNGEIIAITGSNGKTTTASLVYHILKEANLNVGISGNIGNSFSSELLVKDPKDLMVLEISNFQLDDIVTFSPNIAIILNITPDHLDRYNYDFDKYVAAKFRIVMNQNERDHFIFNMDDEAINLYLRDHIPRQKFLAISMESVQKGTKNRDTNKIFQTNLLGLHNAFNVKVAITVGRMLGLNESEIEFGLSTFVAVEHRLEIVPTNNSITFINDSKATNIDSVYYALQAIDGNIVWIVGGVDKGNDYSKIMSLVAEKVESIVCLGMDNNKLFDAFGSVVENMVETDSMIKAVEYAISFVKENSIVLLSPACSSFDLFRNYEDRGTQFKDAVKSLYL